MGFFCLFVFSPFFLSLYAQKCNIAVSGFRGSSGKGLLTVREEPVAQREFRYLRVCEWKKKGQTRFICAASAVVGAVMIWSSRHTIKKTLHLPVRLFPDRHRRPWASGLHWRSSTLSLIEGEDLRPDSADPLHQYCLPDKNKTCCLKQKTWC